MMVVLWLILQLVRLFFSFDTLHITIWIQEATLQVRSIPVISSSDHLSPVYQGWDSSRNRGSPSNPERRQRVTTIIHIKCSYHLSSKKSSFQKWRPLQKTITGHNVEINRSWRAKPQQIDLHHIFFICGSENIAEEGGKIVRVRTSQSLSWHSLFQKMAA